jgi:hypothetical protein
MELDRSPPPSPHQPAFFERVGERILLLLVGPIARVPALYARGRWRFVTTRGAAYATVMTLGLILLNVLAGGRTYSAPLDIKLLLLRLVSYWAVQFAFGALVALFIWRMVERIARLRARAPIA